MDVDAVIFDLDGTILDSEPLHKRAEIEAFRILGLRVTEKDLMPLVGTTLTSMLSVISPGLSVEAFLRVQQPLFTKMIVDEMELFPDAVRLIQRLKVPLGLATSSMQWYVDLTAEKFPILREVFQVRLCAADVVHGKPDPEIFLRACDLLGVSPSRAMVIEDSENGVRAAKAAGCKTVGVDRHALIDLSGADQVVKTLDELCSSLLPPVVLHIPLVE